MTPELVVLSLFAVTVFACGTVFGVFVAGITHDVASMKLDVEELRRRKSWKE